MKLNFYFFKENKRTFDRSELFDFLSDNPYITFDGESRASEKIAYYHNDVINIDAEFVFGEKSVVPDLHKLNPRYLDLNIRLEIELVYPTYKLNKLLNIVEVICKRYQFLIYNEMFNDVLPFRRNTIQKCYEMLKQGYKLKHEEEFMQYSKLNQDDLENVFQYIENKNDIEAAYANTGAIPLKYEFYRKPGSRTTYIATRWDGQDPFIVPSNVHLFIYDDGFNKKYIKFEDLLKDISHSLELLDVNMFPLYLSNPKHVKKIKKYIIKSKYPNIQVTLKSVDLDNILDL